MKILITAPSLDENNNVSGISTLVREIIRHGTCEFSHFAAGRKDSQSAGIVWILKQLTIPIRFFAKIGRERPDIIHINTAFVPLAIIRDSALSFAARLAGVPVLLHLHGGRFLIEDFDRKLIETFARRMLQRASVVLVLSKFEKENLTRRWDLPNIFVLPNAVPLDRVPVDRETQDIRTIIYFGRIHESKGMSEIIEACRILKNEGHKFRFRCFGTGPEKESFVSQMTELLGSQFFYGGVVAGEEKWLELGAADVFLLPSRYGEGLPIAMLEAMAARCVPVAADVASVQSVIEDGKNGFLVDSYNAQQTAEKIRFLLSGSADLKTLGENARKTVEERYSIDDYVKELERLYADLASGQR